MNLDWDNLSNTLISPLSDRKVANIISEISKSLNTRTEIKSYTQMKDFVSAYTLFYLPTNIPKFDFILDQLPQEIRESILNSTFIDFGTGPGTYTLAFLNHSNSKVISIDRSSIMLDQAKRCADHFFPDANVSFQEDVRHVENGGTLFFGHSLNEIDLETFIKIVKKVDPQNIFFIEPGTKYVFEVMKKVRSWANENGYSCVYPCPSIHHICPMRDDDWCHQVLRTQHDPSIERISQMAKLDRRTMPLISHVYTKDSFSRLNENKARIIRYMGETKFSFEWLVCLEEDKLKNIKFEMMKKGLKKSDQKELKKINVGEEVSYKLIKKIKDTKYRVELQI